MSAHRLTFRERLRGPISIGTARPRLACERPGERGERAVVELLVTLGDDGRLGGTAIGTVSIPGLAERAAIEDGRIEPWVGDPEIGMKRARYALPFTARDGRRLELIATTFVRPGRASAHERRTAYVRVLTGDDRAVVGAGVLRVGLVDVVRHWWSVACDGSSWLAAARAYRDRTREELRTRLLPVPS